MDKKERFNHGGSRSGRNFRSVKPLDASDETEAAIILRHEDNFRGRSRDCKDPKITYQDLRNARPNKVHREQYNLSGAFNHVRN